MYPITSDSLLSADFLSSYVDKLPASRGPLFEVIYLRTYSRWIEELSRRERWDETVQRVVEYVLSLYSGHKGQVELIPLAQRLFIKIFNLKVLPAGRTLWIGGSKASRICGEANFNCFKRDTKFLTSDGYASFEDFEDGDEVKILSRFGGWKTATVKNFGKERLVQINIRRGKRTKSIYSTSNHRWILQSDNKGHHNQEKITSRLAPGDKFIVARRYQGQSEPHKVNPCSVAIQHGLVFGDGTFEKSTGSCHLDLCSDSKELEKYITTGHRMNLIYGDIMRIDSLPWNWKKLPPLSANPEYLLGFLSGWFAADGSNSNGQPVLCSANKENLEWARSALALLGIYTGTVDLMRTISPFDGSYKPLYRLNIYKKYLNKEFFLKTNHINNWKTSTESMDWIVESINYTDMEEDVWCIQEPEQECFVLEDGILTRNCSFVVIDELEVFAEIFHLLLCGCGVGFSVESVRNLPYIYGAKKLINIEPVPCPVDERLEETIYTVVGHKMRIYVGDSKSGWVNALRSFISAYTSMEINEIEINYDSVRPKGERIKTFGGHAPGPSGLMLMFKNLSNLLNPLWGQKMKAIDAMDICNFIGKNVIVGGNRRSSEICLFCVDDELLMGAKDEKNFSNNSQRIMSNNSVIYDSKPSMEQLIKQFERISFNGEPGFFNREAASKRRPNMVGINPCGEILLSNRAFCNLSTVVASNHIRNGSIDTDDLYDSVKLAAMIGCLLTNVTVSLPKWDEVQKRDRLIGVSVTGFMDALDNTYITSNSLYTELLLSGMRDAANTAATDFAYELRIPRPLLVTAVKPEGTLSLLPTVSAGLHRAFAPYFIRRVSVADTDPVGKALKYKNVPYVLDPKKPERIIFEFPIKSPATIAADDEPVLDQFNRYLMFMENYVDHNASCTLTFCPETEKDEIIKAVYDNWDKVVATAWLPKHLADREVNPYPFAPYKGITQDEYEARQAKMPASMDDFQLIVDRFELNELFEDQEGVEQDPSCAGAVCPPR